MGKRNDGYLFYREQKYLHKDRKPYLCFVDLEMAFDRISKERDRVITTNERSKRSVKAVISLYERATIKVKSRFCRVR